MQRVAVFLTIVFMAATSSALAGDIGAIVDDCNGCHGDDGVSQWSDVPTIASLSEFYGADQLFFYRDEERPCAESEYRQGDTGRAATTMCAVSADLSDEDMEALGAHYAGLPFVAAQQDFDAGLAASGQAIHDRDCAICHSDGGSNADDDAGVLAGQWMDYMASTFAEYRAGEREQPGAMRKKLDELSDGDVTALLHYYASQQ